VVRCEDDATTVAGEETWLSEWCELNNLTQQVSRKRAFKVENVLNKQEGESRKFLLYEEMLDIFEFHLHPRLFHDFIRMLDAIVFVPPSGVAEGRVAVFAFKRLLEGARKRGPSQKRYV
jgi:hypothetical protein